MPRDPSRPLAVMHIPKTSGVALIGGLLQAVRPNRVVSGFDLCLFGSFDGFATLAPETLRTIYRNSAEVPQGADALAGHMACATLAAAYPTAQLVTFLREPRVRLLSHWVYWRSRTPDKLGPWGAWAAVALTARDPLERFLQRPDVAAQTDNIALRMLLWPHPAIPPGDFIAPEQDAALLAAARARLHGFAFADVIENPALTAALSAWCGADIAYPLVNETPAVPDLARADLERQLTPAATDLLHARTRLDAALWAALAARHAPGAAAARLAEGVFARGVARFTRLLAGG